MPAQVLPNENSFAWFKYNIKRRGFRPRKLGYFRTDFRRLEPKPHKHYGFEAGFEFFANGLKVVVWTTFVESEKQARSSDAGWVLIIEGEKVLYYSRPIHRTKNFLYNLLLAAAIARQRIIHRPKCPCCGALMDIVQGKGLRARFWKCVKPEHLKPIRAAWDEGLPPEVKKQVEQIRTAQKAYKKKLRGEGRKPGAALLQRSKKRRRHK